MATESYNKNKCRLCALRQGVTVGETITFDHGGLRYLVDSMYEKYRSKNMLHHGSKVMVAGLLTFIASVCGVFGQTESLTNADIVAMVRVGLSQEILLRKIGIAHSKFDVSAAGLIELKRAQVPDEIIAAMIDRQEILPSDSHSDKTPVFSESGATTNTFTGSGRAARSRKEMIDSAKSIALAKSSVHPSRQALEKELMKRPEFAHRGLTITRYKDTADLYVEIGYVSLSWITHRYVYRIYDRRSGAVLAAGETTSWGSLAENLARDIAKSLSRIAGETANNRPEGRTFAKWPLYNIFDPSPAESTV